MIQLTKEEKRLKRNKYQREWMKKNGKSKNVNKTRLQIAKSRYGDLRNHSLNPKYKCNNCPFNMSFGQYWTIANMPCYLCGSKELNSADKDIKEIGYTIGNILPCCWKCNKRKSDDSYREFVDYCTMISKKHQFKID